MAELRGEWLDRFERPTPIRRLGGFFLYTAYESDAPRVVALSQSHVDPDWAESVVERVVAVHEAVSHPSVPRVVAHGTLDDLVYVAFECDATHDFADVLESLDDNARLPQTAATGLLALLIDVLGAHHAARDGHDRPIHAGHFSAANLLIGPEGDPWVIGLGTDLLRRQGVGMPWQFEAPELEAVLAGRRPSAPTLDTWVVGAVASAMRGLVDQTGRLGQLERGGRRVDPLLREAWQSLWTRLDAEEPSERFPDVRSLSTALRGVLAQVEIEPSLPALRDFVASTLRSMPAPASAGNLVGDGRYRLERRLGIGRRGSAFLAVDQALGQPVVVRWINADSQDEAARLKREVAMLRSLRHPNVVGGFDLVVDEHRLGAVMEYVDGDTLAVTLARDVPRDQLAASLDGIADALAYLARQGVVHRDVKPQNIVLHPERGAVLVDLGLARPVVTEHAITRPSETLGTFAYMAPEQFRNPSVGSQADVFSFSMVLLDVLAPTLSQHARFPVPDDVRAALAAASTPAELTELVVRGLSLDPASRPPAEAFAGPLRDLANRPASEAESIVIARDASTMRVDDEIVDLRRRRAMRLILRHLVDLHLRDTRATSSVDELLEAGWPDEQVLPASGKARVYVAVSTLRKLARPELIERLDEGYRLGVDAPIRVDAPK